MLKIALEKAMAPRSSTLAWKIPWMEEPGGLPSMGSHRVGHDQSDLAAVAVSQSLSIALGCQCFNILKHAVNSTEGLLKQT